MASSSSSYQEVDLHIFGEEEISCEMRERAYGICRDYLHGAWKQIAPHDMVVKQICGGLSNLLYYCALPPTHPPKSTEPSEVLLRIYGQARSLLTEELGDRELSPLIASKMARIHALNVPISKEPSWLWNTMEKWLKSGQELFSKKPNIDGIPEHILDRVKKFNYRKEIDYLRKIIAKVQSPVVFSHNDMQEGNILLNTQGKTPDDRLSIIDFEYCSYNYRGFDIANHFCEWMYEYKLPVYPYYTVAKENFPEKDKQLFFIRAYLEAYELAKRRKGVSSSGGSNEEQTVLGDGLRSMSVNCNNNTITQPNVSYSPPSHPAEEKILSEVQVFTLAAHLFWSLWSIVQGQVSTIPFGYMEYAAVRLDHYLEEKANLRADTFSKRKLDVITTET
ncbi:choline/ethanolamine kinase isoform X3 [Macrobrachium rosenbergii]|uniref:choline/ethanolamine kinase isoform X3 n=1 Tax=Macrobrachium rosenbergii TaxID=79674 RepID=UPI0034D77ED4